MTTTQKSRLYRILSFERVVEIFNKGELHFAHPSSWDDPYESKLQHRLSDEFFAQCWCKNGVSDAMWRIYSPNHLAVRIRTSRNRLREELLETRNQTGLSFMIQDVKYLQSSTLDAKLQDIADGLAQEFDSKEAARALFFKRTAFKHEAEVRVVVYDENSARRPKRVKGMKIKVAPHRLIENILIDPRAPAAYVAAFKHYLVDKLGFKGPVQQSTLYTGPEVLEIA